MTSPFRANPKPDSEVINLLQRTLVAARMGHIKSVVVVACNPVNEVEAIPAGDLSDLRANALLGGLARATVDLATRK